MQKNGELTASVVGTETVAKRKIFTDIANSLLDFCDEKFSLCLKNFFDITRRKAKLWNTKSTLN